MLLLHYKSSNFPDEAFYSIFRKDKYSQIYFFKTLSLEPQK